LIQKVNSRRSTYSNEEVDPSTNEEEKIVELYTERSIFDLVVAVKKHIYRDPKKKIPEQCSTCTVFAEDVH
jgi:hypothetical protein